MKRMFIFGTVFFGVASAYGFSGLDTLGGNSLGRIIVVLPSSQEDSGKNFFEGPRLLPQIFNQSLPKTASDPLTETEPLTPCAKKRLESLGGGALGGGALDAFINVSDDFSRNERLGKFEAEAPLVTVESQTEVDPFRDEGIADVDFDKDFGVADQFDAAEKADMGEELGANKNDSFGESSEHREETSYTSESVNGKNVKSEGVRKTITKKSERDAQGNLIETTTETTEPLPRTTTVTNEPRSSKTTTTTTEPLLVRF